MKDSQIIFAQNLRFLRISQNMSLRQLATATNISRSALNEYERGLVNPSLSNLIKISRYFNKSIDWIIGEKQN